MSTISQTQNKMSVISQNQTKETQKAVGKKKRKQRRNEKEIKVLQERTTTLLPRSTFKRIVVQEAAKHSTETVRFNVEAVNALQSAAEQELTTIFSGAAFIAGIAKRETITCEDMNNFQTIRKLY
jgi:histone H3/H4